MIYLENLYDKVAIRDAKNAENRNCSNQRMNLLLCAYYAGSLSKATAEENRSKG